MSECTMYHGNTFIAIHGSINEENRILIDIPKRSIPIDITSNINKYLSEYVDKNKIQQYTYVYHCKDTNCVHFPYYTYNLIINILKKFSITFKHVDIRKINQVQSLNKRIKLRNKFQPRDEQPQYIKFLSNNKKSMRLLDSQPGSGKTFSSISACLNLNNRTLIISPANLVEQWYNRLLEYTTIKKDDIYLLVGGESINKLSEIINNNTPINYSIFLASIKTMNNYIVNFDRYFNEEFALYPFTLFKSLELGTKIIDEVHVNFYTNTMIDLTTNIPHNLYLTATPDRSSRKSSKIFSMIYPPFINYHYENYSKYINVIELSYNLSSMKLFLPHKYFVVHNLGYSQNRYEKYILKRKFLSDIIYKKFLVPVIKRYYYEDASISKVKGKLLIFVSLKKTAILITKILKRIPFLKGFKISPYLGEHSEQVLFKNDIVITTFGSAGLGKDLKNVRTIINLVSLRSKVLIEQVMGRIRNSKDIENMRFIFMYNSDLPEHNRHMRSRKTFLEKKAKSVVYEDINNILS